LTEPGGPDPGAASAPSFAHASEAELARILDFYDVRWAYEPDTFPIGWNLDGDVVESFSPDFYLPDLDLYVELTTLKQKLVRKKNRKLRRLRELYPDVQIKLFYARDFRMLLLKFGRLALVNELTGTTGQSTPPRATAGIASEPATDPAIAAMLAVREADAELADPPPPASTGSQLTAAVAAAGRTSEPGAPAVRGRRRGRRRRRPAA
jgi:hypoxanthine phosphoribosyltransferase